jgi:uncharacterized protein YchJ
MLASSPRRGGGFGGKPAGGGGGFGAKRAKAAQPAAPTLEAVLARWPTRLPADAASTPCACGSGDSYADCCRRYHDGQAVPETPLRVLRTRYSAFAYRLPGHVIRTTHRTNRDWREDKVAWARQLNRESMFDSFEFVRLDPGPEEWGREEGPVERGAPEGPQAGAGAEGPQAENAPQGAQEVGPNGTAEGPTIIADEASNNSDVTSNDTEDSLRKPNEAFISFRVVMRNRETGREMALRERSRFLREKGEWLYASGALDAEGELGLGVLNK